MFGLAASALVMGSTSAKADTRDTSKVKLMSVELPYALPDVPAGALGGGKIFLNRCVGGCTVRPGMDDATTDTSVLVNQIKNLPEYTGWQTGEWEAVVQCVKEVYSPFAVTVSDVRPPAGDPYEEIMIGGSPQDIGLPQGVGGVASISPGCTPNPKGVAFAFTSAINVFAQEAGGSRVNGLCWIIAQETAHNFGLSHSYEFIEDGRSACNDPMTYRADCGGQKFYRNKVAREGAFALCGTDGDPSNSCRCGGQQNSHQKLIDVFGAGQSTIPAPTAMVTFPAANSTLGATVTGLAGSKRGVERVELYLNGWKYGTKPGAAFGPQGQQNPASYQFTIPGDLPNSTYDIVLKAYDDLGANTSSAAVTVNKGGPCTSADACSKGQKCENGRCFWDQPAGEIGDACTYPQFCKSGSCEGTTDQQICTQSCIPGTADSCPVDSGLECLETAPNQGVCFFPPDDGGCCSVGHDSTAWVPGAFGALAFGFIALRPRRRKRRA